MRKHYYLDKLGVGKNRPELWDENSKCQKKWKKQRKKFGFDERETWHLDYSWHLWLYERLKMYYNVCDIDLSYHTFIYKDKEYTQEELIGMLLDRLELELGPSTTWAADEQAKEFVNEIETIWALICHSMWW